MSPNLLQFYDSTVSPVLNEEYLTKIITFVKNEFVPEDGCCLTFFYFALTYSVFCSHLACDIGN